MKTKRSKVRYIIKIVLIVILSLWLIIFIAHKIMTCMELSNMKKEGIYNPVNTGKYDLNVYLYGNENGKHTIVGMSGQGVNTYSMGLKATVDRFAADNRIAVVDRAGYGLSDSTTVPQTVEQVVQDYRTALRRAGCETPYILVPHSLGALYATYWENVYPDEIEGILYLDGSGLGEENSYGSSATLHELLLSALCATGLQRIFHDSMKGEISWRNLTLQQEKYAKAMEMHSTYNLAQHSESVHETENFHTVAKIVKPTDIPKIYVYALPTNREDVIEYLEYRNESYRRAGRKPLYDMNDTAMIDAKVREFEESSSNQLRKASYYCNGLGNCSIRTVGGIHNIYKQKPEELAALLAELIAETEK